jgi:two-component system nitrogen regulation sensor histidine kinase GlnL
VTAPARGLAAGEGAGPDAHPDSEIDFLTTAVLLVDAGGRVARANLAAETAFDASRRMLQGQALRSLFVQSGQVDEIVREALAGAVAQHRLLVAIRRPLRDPLPVQVLASANFHQAHPLVVEVFEAPGGTRAGGRGEERRGDAGEANRRLLRNLAHEIKNPLGGIRGAAQLLQAELPASELRDFTRVIISESDRLQTLLDRVLAPHRGASNAAIRFNIHEACERVRSVILAEHPAGLVIHRDYDASVPDCHADREQLIQALLNIVRNAAQALRGHIAQGEARIELRTRVARQVTFARRHCRLALELRITDNGPGVPEDIRDRIFDPLVSGREDGSGLGLALAHTFVDENDGMIDFDSEPGRTQFRILLPLDAAGPR